MAFPLDRRTNDVLYGSGVTKTKEDPLCILKVEEERNIATQDHTPHSYRQDCDSDGESEASAATTADATTGTPKRHRDRIHHRNHTIYLLCDGTTIDLGYIKDEFDVNSAEGLQQQLSFCSYEDGPSSSHDLCLSRRCSSQASQKLCGFSDILSSDDSFDSESSQSHSGPATYSTLRHRMAADEQAELKEVVRSLEAKLQQAEAYAWSCEQATHEAERKLQYQIKANAELQAEIEQDKMEARDARVMLERFCALPIVVERDRLKEEVEEWKGMAETNMKHAFLMQKRAEKAEARVCRQKRCIERLTSELREASGQVVIHVQASDPLHTLELGRAYLVPAMCDHDSLANKGKENQTCMACLVALAHESATRMGVASWSFANVSLERLCPASPDRTNTTGTTKDTTHPASSAHKCHVPYHYCYQHHDHCAVHSQEGGGWDDTLLRVKVDFDPVEFVM